MNAGEWAGTALAGAGILVGLQSGVTAVAHRLEPDAPVTDLEIRRAELGSIAGAASVVIGLCLVVRYGTSRTW